MQLTKWLNKLVIITLILAATNVQAQQELTLADALSRARENYPAIRQKGLIQQTESITINNLNKNYLPQLSFNGQATYQSDVTSVNIPLPGVNITPMSKEQYKFTADVNQLLFDGGTTGQQKKIQKLNAQTEDQKTEVELYRLRERIDQVYLSILYLEEQLKQVDLTKKDIQSGISKMEAQVKNGIAFRSNLDVLKAEFLKVEQRAIELQATREGLIETLGLFMGQTLDAHISLKRPEVPALTTDIRRPEIELYSRQEKLTEQQKGLALSKSLPKMSLFAQGGYGRPGLNMLNNEFDWFYLAGIRLNWNLGGFYTYKNEKKLINLNKEVIQLQKETFLLNTQTQLTQQLSEIKKQQQLIASDEEIIALRKNVKNAAKVQLENGVITANDYLREVNAEDLARQTLVTHQLQLLQAQINYQHIAGN